MPRRRGRKWGWKGGEQGARRRKLLGRLSRFIVVKQSLYASLNKLWCLRSIASLSMFVKKGLRGKLLTAFP